MSGKNVALYLPSTIILLHEKLSNFLLFVFTSISNSEVNHNLMLMKTGALNDYGIQKLKQAGGR